MSDVARLLLARGATLSDLARARAAIWGNAVQNIAAIPLQVQQQAQQQKRLDALTLLEQARAQREQGLYDQAQKTAQRADALHQNMLQVYRRAYSGDPANPDFDEARRAATEIGDPDVIDATESWIEKRQPQIEPAAPGSMARYKTGPQAGQTVPGSLVPEKPPAPSEAGFAAALNDPDPAKRAAAQASLDALQAPRKAQEAETARHNAEMERIGRMQVGRAEAAQMETARHNKAMEDAADPSSPKKQAALEQQYRTVLARGLSSRSGGLGAEDAKVQQANHALSLMDQFYDPKTGDYNIPRVQLNELALSLARLTAGTGPAGEGMMREFQQRTVKGDIAGALTYLTGQPVASNTQAITKMLRESIERQGMTAEQNREGEMRYLRGLAPTDLDESRRQALEATSLNPLRRSRIIQNKQTGERKLQVSLDGGKTWQ